MIKYLSCILYFYTLMLGLIPCCDYDLQQDEDNMEISHNEKHEHEGLDFCSPFCTCQCCQVGAMQFHLGMIVFNNPNVRVLRQNFFYIENKGNDLALSILQPPRV